MKTNFLNKLKQGLFLLIAVLGTFVGFSQSTQNPTIGGSKTPTDTGGLLDIGGGKSSDGGIGQIGPSVDIATKAQCSFAYLGDTGGGGKGTDSGTGQVDSPDDLDDSDTGGRGTSTDTGQITYYDQSYEGDTGGGKSSDGGLNPSLPKIDIGGRSTGGDLADDDTGGKNSTGGLEIYCPLCPDTGGGNGGKSTTGEIAYFDTGGRDSGGGLNPLNDIGGRGGSDTGPGFIFDTGVRTPSEIGFVETQSNISIQDITACCSGDRGTIGTGNVEFYHDQDQFKSNLSKIQRFGCVLRPIFITD